ncbi:MAG: FtsX-like permease family protein [Candidatus Heimdallarchaeaceae archaeon]
MNIKKRLILLLIVTLTFTSSVLVLSQNGIEDNAQLEDLLVLTKFEGNEQEIVSRTVIDEFGNLHFFGKIQYDNGTFFIFHAVGNNISIIIWEDNSDRFFLPLAIPGGVVLFYSFHTFYGTSKYYMYTWTPDSSTNMEFYTTNEIFSFNPSIYVYYNESFNGFNMFIMTMTAEGSDPLTEIVKTKIREFRVSMDGTYELGLWWIIDYEYDFLIDFDYVNGQLYAQYRYMDSYNPTHRYYTIVTSFNNTYISNYMEIEEGGFNPVFYVTEDGAFHTRLLRSGNLYYLDYEINDTISFDMFNVTDIGLSTYKDYTIFKYEGYETFIFNSNPYIEYEEFFEDKGLKSKVTVLNNNYTHFEKEEFYLYNVPELDNYHSFYMQHYENGSKVYTHSTVLTRENFDQRRLVEDIYIGIYITTDLPISYSNEPLVIGLEVLTSFQQFWVNIGVYLTIAIVTTLVFYFIFMKKVHKMFSDFGKFLVRPGKKASVKFALIFINIWNFISNTFTTLYILFKTNKRRHLMNLIGMTILSLILITSTSLYTSKQKVLLSEYTDNIDLIHNSVPSMSMTISYDTFARGSSEPIISNFNEAALSEIFTLLKLEYKTLASIIGDVDYASFMYGTGMDPDDNDSIAGITYSGVSVRAQPILEVMLTEGRLPETVGEVVIGPDVALETGLDINDSMKIYGARRGYYNFELGSTFGLVKIVGFIESLGSDEIREYTRVNDIPYDTMKVLESFGGLCITYNDFYFTSLEGLNPYYTTITTYVQFLYDFAEFSPTSMETLRLEQEEIVANNIHEFGFAENAAWHFSDELGSVIDTLGPKLNSSIFLFFTLALPILYLAIFLIFETNELYSKSMEQEIEIFKSKGLSTARIAMSYTALKVAEAILATAIGFGISMALTPALIKMDSFITFNNTFAAVDVSNVPLAAAFTILALILISLPKTISTARSKRKEQKTPQRILVLLKRIRLPTILLIVTGGIIMYLSYLLYKYLFSAVTESGSNLLMIFIYIAGTGVLLAMLGFGLLLKDLHSIIMIAISKIAWMIKKSVASFSLIEIRSDVHLFNNIFLTFFILVGIILPSIICPVSVQYNFEKDALMYAGADLYVKNWNDENITLLAEIEALPEVVSTANVSAIDGHYGGEQINIYVLNNITEYLATAYTPPKDMFPDWEERIGALDSNKTMLSTHVFKEEIADGWNSIMWSNYYQTYNSTFQIVGIFDYFPIFYDVGPFIDGKSRSVNALAIAEHNYQYIEPAIIEFGSYKDRLLIKLDNEVDHSAVRHYLEEQYQLTVISAVEEGDATQFRSYPFYSIISAEFAMSILICLIAIVFISISNPIKLLQQRTNKNDRLKKMGISTKRIIRLAAVETFIAGVFPGLVMGAAFGFGLVGLFIWTTKNFFYSGMGFKIVVAPIALIISFVIAPVLFYVLFYYAMKRNYARYLPRNLE